MTVFISILAVVLMLGIFAAAHELGHFFVARLFKVKAYEVSVFLGPALFKWRRKDVDYSIRCIPVGAYVRFNDFDNEGNPVVSDDPALLINQPRWKRLIIALAGPFVNFLLGIIIFSAFFCVTGYETLKLGATEEGLQMYGLDYEIGDTVVAVDGHKVFTSADFVLYFDFKDAGEPTVLTIRSKETGKKHDITLNPEVSERGLIGITRNQTLDPETSGWVVSGNSNPASDLKAGDIVTAVNGIAIADYEALDDFFKNTKEGDIVEVTYIRDGKEIKEEIPLVGGTYVNGMGITLLPEKVTGVKSFFSTVYNGIKTPFSVINMTKMVISHAISGEVKAYQVISGPIGVVNIVDNVVAEEKTSTTLKLSTLVTLAAFVTVALSISNMLPLPGLDGAQIIILLVEMVIGRKLPQKIENMITVIGFFVMILLLLLAFASDITKIVVEGW